MYGVWCEAELVKNEIGEGSDPPGSWVVGLGGSSLVSSDYTFTGQLGLPTLAIARNYMLLHRQINSYSGIRVIFNLDRVHIDQ
jgi:hypothetical protein